MFGPVRAVPASLRFAPRCPRATPARHTKYPRHSGSARNVPAPPSARGVRTVARSRDPPPRTVTACGRVATCCDRLGHVTHTMRSAQASGRLTRSTWRHGDTEVLHCWSLISHAETQRPQRFIPIGMRSTIFVSDRLHMISLARFTSWRALPTSLCVLCASAWHRERHMRNRLARHALSPHPSGPARGATTARHAKYPRRPRRVASERWSRKSATLPEDGDCVREGRNLLRPIRPRYPYHEECPSLRPVNTEHAKARGHGGVSRLEFDSLTQRRRGRRASYPSGCGQQYLCLTGFT